MPRSATCRYCSQKSTFCPRRGKTELDRKMVATSHNGHDELYHRVKFGGDRTTSAGCRCENIVFVCMFVLCHAQRPARCSFEGCIVRTSIALPISTRFSAFFSEGNARLGALQPHKVREIAVLSLKKFKNRRKIFCARLSIDN